MHSFATHETEVGSVVMLICFGVFPRLKFWLPPREEQQTCGYSILSNLPPSVRSSRLDYPFQGKVVDYFWTTEPLNAGDLCEIPIDFIEL
jgi:hypothetical protein